MAMMFLLPFSGTATLTSNPSYKYCAPTVRRSHASSMHMLELMLGAEWPKAVRTELTDTAPSPILMRMPGRETARLETPRAVKEGSKLESTDLNVYEQGPASVPILGKDD